MGQMIMEYFGHFLMLDDDPKLIRMMTDFLAIVSVESPCALQRKGAGKHGVRCPQAAYVVVRLFASVVSLTFLPHSGRIPFAQEWACSAVGSAPQSH